MDRIFLSCPYPTGVGEASGRVRRGLTLRWAATLGGATQRLELSAHRVKINSKGRWKLALSRTGIDEEAADGVVSKTTVAFKGKVQSSKKMAVAVTASTQLLYPGETWEPPTPIIDEDGNVIGTDPGSGPFAQTKCIAVPLKVTSKWRKPTSTGL